MRLLPLALVWMYSLSTCRFGAAERVDTRGLSAASELVTSIARAQPLEHVQALITQATPITKPAPEPTPRVIYALAKHLRASELRHGQTQLFDFGVPGDAKYTLGGWLSVPTETREVDGRSCLLVRGRQLRVILPADSGGDHVLSLELRSFTAATLALSLNGKPLPISQALSGKGFERVVITLPAPLVTPGEHALDLRVTPASASDHGFALDFMALSREPLAANERPETPAELIADNAPETLRITPQLRLGYAFELPKDAAFTARVYAPTPALLSLRLVREGEPDHVLTTVAVGPNKKPLRVDLAGFGRDVVRLELEADGAPVSVESPAITSGHLDPHPHVTKPIHNVVLYLIDTLRADKLSAYNPHTRVRTPGLTRFLENAAVMKRARAQENWTKPSVATLLSSLYPWQHNAVSDRAVLPASVQLLPETLSEQGFFSGGFIANGYVSDKFGMAQGFTTYRNYIRENRPSLAENVATDVLEWLDARPLEKPFFLYVHTIDPHVPYRPPGDFLTLYDREPYSGPVDFARSGDLLEHIKLGKQPLERRDKDHLIALYDGEISYHDVHFDAIMAGLDKRGLADDTMVIVTADHGEEFWDHGSVGHGHSVFDELLHVPLIVRLPGVTHAGDEVLADVGLVDVMPTILEALGQTPPETLSGHSFLPELLGDSADAPRVSVSGFMGVWRTLSVGRYKLVQRGLERCVLYDTQNDPAETTDLSSAKPLALRYLRAALGLELAANMPHELPRPVYTAETTAIDPATEQQLRALGYVGSSRH